MAKSIINLLSTLKTRMLAMEWKASSETLFAADSVKLSLGIFTEENIKSLRPPILIITPGTAIADREQPAFQTYNITFTIINFQAGDQYGEYPLMGRQDSADNVEEAGILEIAEEIKKEIQHLTRFDGAEMNYYSVSQMAAQLDSSGYNYIISMDINFEGRVSSE